MGLRKILAETEERVRALEAHLRVRYNAEIEGWGAMLREEWIHQTETLLGLNHDEKPAAVAMMTPCPPAQDGKSEPSPAQRKRRCGRCRKWGVTLAINGGPFCDGCAEPET